MHFYTLSDGEYSDYYFTIMYHEKKFTNKEFVKMYNSALKGSVESRPCDAVAEKMAEMFGFKIVEEQFEINAGYEGHKKIDLKDVDEEHRHYSLP